MPKTISVSATKAGAMFILVEPALKGGALEAVGDVMKGDLAAASAKLPQIIESYKNEAGGLIFKAIGLGVARKGLQYFGVKEIAGFGPIKIRV
jgi:hypothetical protein